MMKLMVVVLVAAAAQGWYMGAYDGLGWDDGLGCGLGYGWDNLGYGGLGYGGLGYGAFDGFYGAGLAAPIAAPIGFAAPFGIAAPALAGPALVGGWWRK